MLISSDANGGEIVSSSSDTRFYDDIACLASDWATGHENATGYVRLPDGRWIDAEAASYVQRSDAHSAMGSGLVAFATISDASAAAGKAPVLAFADVVGLVGVHR